jgi:hypothetical protein
MSVNGILRIAFVFIGMILSLYKIWILKLELPFRDDELEQSDNRITLHVI